MKRDYEHEQRKQAHRKEMRKLGITWEIFKAVYIACVIMALASAGMYAVRMLYGI